MNSYQAGKKLLCGEYTSFTVSGKGLFVRAKRWFTEPEIGDIVYFYHASMGRVAHVGIVVDVIRGIFGTFTITTVEGNTEPGKRFSRDGGSVAEKRYTFHKNEVGGKHLIDGFGRPVYGADTCTAAELIAAARAEIGYVEKASAAQLENRSGNPGDKNYTKFGAWYGLNAAPWCQEFVSWCAYTACAAHRAKAHTGWEKAGDRWTYIDENGEKLAGRWAYIGGRWYVFDNAGYMIRGWFKDRSGWYYMADDGGMLAGQWLDYNGEQYYLTKTGAMAKNAYVRSEKTIAPGRGYIYYRVDGEGRWDASKDTETPDYSDAELAE